MSDRAYPNRARASRWISVSMPQTLQNNLYSEKSELFGADRYVTTLVRTHDELPVPRHGMEHHPGRPRLRHVSEVARRAVVDLPVRVHARHPVSHAPQSDAHPAHVVAPVGDRGESDGDGELATTTGAFALCRFGLGPVIRAVGDQDGVVAGHAEPFGATDLVVHAYLEDPSAASGTHRLDDGVDAVATGAVVLHVLDEGGDAVAVLRVLRFLWGHLRHCARRANACPCGRESRRSSSAPPPRRSSDSECGVARNLSHILRRFLDERRPPPDEGVSPGLSVVPSDFSRCPHEDRTGPQEFRFPRR
ncbi:hypothetical protein RHCRD62_60311 [Rhodococcus sp. RD6.2]|nr:hypothetical protein RHCRD62_60311 [Rhodococcus sp. RD6.2]